MWRRVVLLVAPVLVACGVAFVPPGVSPRLVEAARARWPAATRDSLQRGHDTFVASCGRGGFCHGLKDPLAYPAERWPRIVDKMSRRAHLADAQQEDVLRFVLAARDLAAAGPASNPAVTGAPPGDGAAR